MVLLFAISAGAQDVPKHFSYDQSFIDPLNTMNLEPSDVMIDPNWIEFSSSVQLTPLHKLLFKNPFQAVEINKRYSQHLADSPPTYFVNHLINLSILANKRIHFLPSNPWDSNEPSQDQFMDILFKIEKLRGTDMSPDLHKQWEELYSEITKPERIVLFELMRCLSRAWPWLKAARTSIPKEIELSNIFTSYYINQTTPLKTKNLNQFDKTFDQRALYLAAAEFAHFLSSFLDQKKNQSLTFTNNIQINSPFGSIVISTDQSDDQYHFDTPPLFLLDVHGDDQYMDHYSLADVSTPFSITIDMEGNDHYISEKTFQGAGSSTLGFSSLIDLGEGHDEYTGRSQCFGYSFAGVSLIYNASGNTTYELESHGLGATDWGLSMLIDATGSDTYRSFFKSQGSGFMNGIGLLLDLEGNDAYIAEATPVKFPSSQLPEQNLSASQGFGGGRFGPYEEGYSFAGGIGLLIDKQGDDFYKASVFAQGAGHGFGLGFLSDLAGDDRYHNSWYALGSAAHQACGIAYDATGNDHVKASHYMIGGSATDLSLGLFMDEYGNDNYEATNASFGYSLTNSVSIMIELQGDDQYLLHNGGGFGLALNKRKETLRGLWPTFGFFMDQHGKDLYQTKATKLDSLMKHDSSVNANVSSKEYRIGIDLSTSN